MGTWMEVRSFVKREMTWKGQGLCQCVRVCVQVKEADVLLLASQWRRAGEEDTHDLAHQRRKTDMRQLTALTIIVRSMRCACLLLAHGAMALNLVVFVNISFLQHVSRTGPHLSTNFVLNQNTQFFFIRSIKG
jgi:hypothetical protein